MSHYHIALVTDWLTELLTVWQHDLTEMTDICKLLNHKPTWNFSKHNITSYNLEWTFNKPQPMAMSCIVCLLSQAARQHDNSMKMSSLTRPAADCHLVCKYFNEMDKQLIAFTIYVYIYIYISTHSSSWIK